MRKLLVSFLFLIIPVSVLGWTTTNHFDSLTTGDGWYVWYGSSFSHPTINSNQSAPGSPSNSFQIKSDAGLPDSSTVGGESFVFPSATKEYWMQYYVKFSSNYQYHTVSNKQIYTWFGTGNASCVTFGPNSTVGNHFCAICENSQGWYNPNTEYNPSINKDQWYKVVFHAKLVSAGNDIFQLWVDDGLVLNYSNTNLAVNSSDRASGFTKVGIDPVWGGQASPPVSKSVTDYLWFAYVIVSTDPILVDSLKIGGGDTIKIPSPPKTLIIN